MRFKVGQRVKGKPGSGFYEQSVKNGKETGIVSATRFDNPKGYHMISGFDYLVLWDWEARDRTPHYNYNDRHLIAADVDSNEEGLEYLASSDPF